MGHYDEQYYEEREAERNRIEGHRQNLKNQQNEIRNRFYKLTTEQKVILVFEQLLACEYNRLLYTDNLNLSAWLEKIQKIEENEVG